MSAARKRHLTRHRFAAARRIHRYRSRIGEIEQPTFFQFVVLSMLLHTLIVVVFREPAGLGGRSARELRPFDLSAILRPLTRERTREAAVELRETRPPIVPKPVIAPPEMAPAPPRPAPRRETTDRNRMTVPATRPAPAPALAPSEPKPPERIETPPPEPVIPRETIETPRAIEREAPLPPEPAPFAPIAPLPKIELEAPKVIEREFVPPPEAPARPATRPDLEPKPVEAPPRIDRQLLPPPELAPVPKAEPEPKPVEAPPRIDRQIAPAEPPRIEKVAPVKPTVEVPVETSPIVPREIAPVVPPPAAAVPTLPRGLPGVPPPPSFFPSAPQSIERAQTPPPAPAATPSPPAPEGKLPRIDLEASRRAAREFNRDPSKYADKVPLNLAAPGLEPDSKLGRGIAKSAQPDCRTAYADLGLLAVVPLAKDAVTNNGCKW